MTSPEFRIVDEAENGFEALRKVVKHKPDLILLDISMPKMSGVSIIKDIKRQSPRTKVLVLTIHRDEEYIITAFESGADGYCLKAAHFEELLIAIKKVMTGKRFLSPEISDVILDGYLKEKKRQRPISSLDSLTLREKEVLKLIGEGHKNAQIAEYLFISVKTVEKHRANLMKKLDRHNAAELTAYAIQHGMVEK